MSKSKIVLDTVYFQFSHTHSSVWQSLLEANCEPKTKEDYLSVSIILSQIYIII